METSQDCIRDGYSNLSCSRSTDTVIDSSSSLWRALDCLKKQWAVKYSVVNDREQEEWAAIPASSVSTPQTECLETFFKKHDCQLIIKPTSHASFPTEITISNWKSSCRVLTGQHPSCLCHLSGIQPNGHRRLA